MNRIGIIGCGKIADAHVLQIQRLSDCVIVGVCDTEELMAKQLYDRYPIKRYFSDVKQFLEVAKPDIVHITTPPKSHLDLGKLCLDAGCNIYFEKPFTLNTTEAKQILNLAEEKNLKITVGHNAQFNNVEMRMRALINNGFLGGPPVHLESIWCYNFGDKRYAKALLGDKNHWVRKLPGKLLHNIINHGVSKIAEFLTGDNPTVIAHGFTSPFLKSINEYEIVDELRVIIQDESFKTAYFTFSSQMSPKVHQFRIFGPKNTLIVDDDHQALIKVKNYEYKSYLKHFIPPGIIAKEYAANSVINIRDFFKRELNFESGRKYLIENFYQAIKNNKPLPIAYSEILLTSKIMDEIFQQLNSNRK